MSPELIAFLRWLVLPYGATSGTRIVLDGINGRIEVYNAANTRIGLIDDTGFWTLSSNGSYVRMWAEDPGIGANLTLNPPDIVGHVITPATLSVFSDTVLEYSGMRLTSPQIDACNIATFDVTSGDPVNNESIVEAHTNYLDLDVDDAAGNLLGHLQLVPESWGAPAALWHRNGMWVQAGDWTDPDNAVPVQIDAPGFVIRQADEIMKGIDENSTATAYHQDARLQLWSPPNVVLFFEVFLSYSCSVAAQLKVKMFGPAGSSVPWGFFHAVNPSYNTAVLPWAEVTGIAGGGVGMVKPYRLWGQISMGASGGYVGVSWAKVNADGGSQSTVYRDSFMRLRRA